MDILTLRLIYLMKVGNNILMKDFNGHKFLVKVSKYTRNYKAGFDSYHYYKGIGNFFGLPVLEHVPERLVVKSAS